MKRHLFALLAFVFGALAVWSPCRRSASAAGRPLVVVVSSAVPLTEISLGLLRRAFLGEPTEFAPGKRLIPVNQAPDTPDRQRFDRAVLGLAWDQIGAFWIDRRIRDQPLPPRTAPNASLVVRLAISLPGIIGYVSPELVNDKVRVLKIDGKVAGQAGYLLAD